MKKILIVLLIIAIIVFTIFIILIKVPKNVDKIITDTQAPIIVLDDSYIVKKGYDKEIIDVILSADDIDKNPKREIIGEYDFNTVGEYQLTYRVEDNSGNITTKAFILKVKDSISYTEEEISFEDAIKNYKNQNTEIGIDVSKWQEKIDWKKIKEAGVEFAILRIAYQKGFDGEIVIDPYFEENYKGCIDNDISFATYYSSYDKSVEEAKNHANWICNYINNNNIPNIFVAFDWENWSSFNKLKISLNDINNIADTFMNEIQNAGNKSMLYGSKTYLEAIWKNEYKYPVWLANYVSNTSYEGDYDIWQFTQKGKVNGINGYVDINVLKK